jgi:hypothetical protein
MASVKQSKPAVRKRPVTRTVKPSTKKRSRDTSPRHVVLLDRSGTLVRRCTASRETTYLLNLRNGHYYDQVNLTTFVQRIRAHEYADGAFPGWACGKDHTYPVHRKRIIAALKLGSAHPEESERAP